MRAAPADGGPGPDPAWPDPAWPDPSPPDPAWFRPGLDGTYGYRLADLRAVEPAPEPSGLAALWRAWHAEARATPPAVRVLSRDRVGDREVLVVEHTADAGLRLRAWLALPAGGAAPRLGVVHGHGYGGRTGPDLARVPDDAAVVFPVARGLGALNAGVGAPSDPDLHVVHGLESVRTSAVARSAADLWHAASALVATVGDVPLYHVGESFGGGTGALAVPWDDRFVGATLVVPTFGRHDVRLALACEGSGEAVRRHVTAHPDALDVLRFVDASATAGRFRVPVRVECALWDRVVPPPGQFAVAHAVARAAAGGSGAGLELAVLPAGHAEHPGVDALRARAAAATRAHAARCADRSALV